MARRLPDLNPELDPPGYLAKDYDVVGHSFPLLGVSQHGNIDPFVQPVTGARSGGASLVNVAAYSARAWELTKAQGPALFQLGLSMCVC